MPHRSRRMMYLPIGSSLGSAARSGDPRRMAGVTDDQRRYFRDVNMKSHDPTFHRSSTPATSLLSMFGCVSHSSGSATALLTSCLSMAPQAWAAAVGSVISCALSIAELIAGSLSCDQLALLVGTIALPLNGTYSTVSGLSKSRIQPADGHTSISCLGTPQYLEYI